MTLDFRALLRPIRLCAIVSLLLASNSTFAQQLDFKFGTPVPEDDYARSFNPTNRQAFVYHYGKKESTITILDNYINAGKKIPFPKEVGRNIAYYNINGRSYFIFANADKETKIQTVSYQEIGADLQFVGKPSVITSFKNVKVGGVLVAMPFPENLTVVKSPNESQILIYKERDKKIEAVCFNPNKGVQWTHTFALGDEKRQHEIIDIEITNAGDMYLLGTSLDRNGDALDPFVLSYTADSKKEGRHLIPTDADTDHWGYCLRFINDDTPVVAGIYKKKKTKLPGYRVLKMDTKTKSMQLFSTALFTAAYTAVTYDGAYHPEYYRVVDILHLENGSMVFSIEGRAIKSGKSIYTVYSSAAYVVSIDPAGKEQWNSTVNKYQIEVQSSYSTGHYLLSKGNTVFMIYNDNLDNFDKDVTIRPDEALLKNKTYVALVEINSSGGAKKLNFISQSKKEISSIDSRHVKRIAPNLFHFMFKTGENYKHATLEANGNIGIPEQFVNDGSIRGYVAY
jgi:hypothetical protein